MRTLRLALVVVPLVLVCLVVDASLLELTSGERLLDPYLLLTAWFAANGRPADGMLVGATAGLAQDLRTGVVVGVHFVAKVVVGYGAQLLSGQLIPGQPTTHAILAASATVVAAVVVKLLGTLLGRAHDLGSLAWLAAQVAVNAVVATVAYAAVERWRRRRGKGAAHGPHGR